MSLSPGQEQDAAVPQQKEDLPNYKECTRSIQPDQLNWCYQQSGHEHWKRCLTKGGRLPVVTIDFAEILNLELLKKFLHKKREEPERGRWSMCTITLTDTT